jgi:8-amino-7-oxononanoate synthase
MPLSGPGWDRWVDEQLDGVQASGRWRQVRALDGGGPEFALGGRRVVSFASNDYLGLSQHPAVLAAAHQALDRWGSGAGSARLIVGSRPVHEELEAALAAWKGAERALLFPTGYGANLGVLSVLGRGATVVSDELNHASIIDGCRLARAEVRIYRHGDAEQAASLIRSAPGRSLVVTDAVFSMDGDLAPLAELSSACAATGALLVIDEAHAVLGTVPLDPDARVVRVGTLSKALGSLGGFVAAPANVIDLLVNRARPFIFTTASTPSAAAAALAALEVVRSGEGRLLCDRLAGHVQRVRPAHPSPIVPFVLGDEDMALKASAALLERDLLVPAIRPPTVPPGTSRLRVALSAAHTDAQIDQLLLGLSACAW